MGATRGCGTRVRGGAYAECPTSPYGKPTEHFIIDPPSIVDVDAIGLSPHIVQLVELQCYTCNGLGTSEKAKVLCFSCKGTGKINHVMDWIGEQHYPNVADFLEEAGKLGVSLRLPASFDFSKLTVGSRLMLVHRRAHIDNWQTYSEAEFGLKNDGETVRPCPLREKYKDVSPGSNRMAETMKAQLAQHDITEMCARYWWQDITVDITETDAPKARGVSRSLPCNHRYEGFLKPPKAKPVYRPAMFAWFPIIRIAVIEDDQAKQHVETLEKVSKAGIPAQLEKG